MHLVPWRMRFGQCAPVLGLNPERQDMKWRKKRFQLVLALQSLSKALGPFWPNDPPIFKANTQSVKHFYTFTKHIKSNPMKKSSSWIIALSTATLCSVFAQKTNTPAPTEAQDWLKASQ